MSKVTPPPSQFASIKKAFYDPEFYKIIPSLDFGRVMGYLLLIVTLGYVLLLGRGAIFLYQNQDKIREGADEILNGYPEELELTWTDGVLTTNVQEPYFFPENPFFDKENERYDGPEYFVVIDTKTPFSAEQFEDYEVIAWLSSDAAYVEDKNEGIKILPYPEESVIVDKEMVDKFAVEIWDEIKYTLLGFGIFLTVLADFGFFLYFFVYLAIVTVVVFIFSQAAGLKRPYAECYRLAVYAMTPAWTLSLLVNWLNLAVPLMLPPFLFTAVLLVTLWLNVRKQETKA